MSKNPKVPMAAMNAVLEPIRNRAMTESEAASKEATDLPEKNRSFRERKFAAARGRSTVNTAVISLPE